MRIVGEAGQEEDLTPLDAAQQFADQHLPDLGTALVSLPEEIVGYDVSETVGFPGLLQEELANLKSKNEASIKEIVDADIKVLKNLLEKPVTIDKQKYESSKKKNLFILQHMKVQNLELKKLKYDNNYLLNRMSLEAVVNGDKAHFTLSKESLDKETAQKMKDQQGKFDAYFKHLRGKGCEIDVFTYAKKSLTGPATVLWSFEQMKTQTFLGWKSKQQEYDVICLIPGHKLFVIVEVKAEPEFKVDHLKSLRAGQIFFNDLKGHFNLNDWVYCPVLAYPKIKDRGGVHYNSGDDLKPVFLTAEEMKINFIEILKQELNVQVDQSDELQLDCYMKLAKIMYASQRAEKVKKSKGNIGFHLAGPEDLVDKVQKKLVGEAGSDVSAGFDEKRLTSDGKKVFSDLRGESLGSINSFIYWNASQG